MRRFRMLGAAASVTALLGAAAATGGPAVAATNGVGTTRATTSVLNVALGQDGSLLNVRVVGDDGSANIDPKQGSPSSAASSISPLTSTSSVGLLNVSLPKVSVSSTGAANNQTLPPISLTTPLGSTISSGTIDPLSLSAVVDAANGAASGLSSKLNNVSIVGGLVSLPHLSSTLGAAAKPGDADGLRGLSTENQPIKVLNLGAVLQGLGIDPSALTVTQVGNVLDALQMTISTPAGALNGTGLGTLSGLQTVLTTLPPGGVSGLPASTAIGGLPAPVQSAITTALGGSLPGGVSTIGDLQTLLTNAFTSALNTIGGATLLQVDSLDAGVTTKAADTVANSVADIKASVGTIHVGNQAFSGVDLIAIANSVSAKIDSVLSGAGLSNLVTVKVLDQSKSVATQNGYVSALANLTGLHVAIAPLAANSPGTAQAGGDTMSQILGSGNVPALSSQMQTLNTTLATTGAALTQGATVDVLSVGAASTFTPSPASTPSNPAAPTAPAGTLATTGGPTQLLGFVGLLLLATVAGLRWLRRPATTD